jgi:hypothetical protein
MAVLGEFTGQKSVLTLSSAPRMGQQMEDLSHRDQAT